MRANACVVLKANIAGFLDFGTWGGVQGKALVHKLVQTISGIRSNSKVICTSSEHMPGFSLLVLPSACYLPRASFFHNVDF